MDNLFYLKLFILLILGLIHYTHANNNNNNNNYHAVNTENNDNPNLYEYIKSLWQLPSKNRRPLLQPTPSPSSSAAAAAAAAASNSQRILTHVEYSDEDEEEPIPEFFDYDGNPIKLSVSDDKPQDHQHLINENTQRKPHSFYQQPQQQKQQPTPSKTSYDRMTSNENLNYEEYHPNIESRSVWLNHHNVRKQYQSLCPTDPKPLDRIQFDTEYEYRPSEYFIYPCKNATESGKYVQSRTCSMFGECVNVKKTIHILRCPKGSRSNCDCSPKTFLIDNCECKWPKHEKGDIKEHFTHSSSTL